MVNLQIQETGMLEAFYDFCENLDEEMFYSYEEAEQIVEEKMKDGDWKQNNGKKNKRKEKQMKVSNL